MEKLLITSNFSFSYSVFKGLRLQTGKNQGLFGKGLKEINHLSHLNTHTKKKTSENKLILTFFSGLLKKLSEDDSNCQALFSVKKDDQTMLTVLKKFLLSKQHALQTDVGEILLLIMSKSRREEYGKAILNSDIAGISISHITKSMT